MIPIRSAAALSLGLILAVSPLARAATPRAPSASASAPATRVDTKTVVTIPSGWQVGDRASFRIERIATSENMTGPSGNPAPVKISMDVEVLSVAQDGNAVHRLRLTGGSPKTASGTETVTVDLEMSSQGQILRVINLDALLDTVRQSQRQLVERVYADQPEAERQRRLDLLDRNLSPEVFKKNLLELPAWAYSAGLGEQYRGGTAGSLPTRREVLGTGVSIDTVRRYRVDTDAATRGAVITTLEEVPGDAMPAALAASMARINAQMGVQDAKTEGQLREGMAQVLAELKMGLRTEGRFEVEDRQPWPRAVTERRIVSGVRDGKPMRMSIETTLTRTDRATPSATPATPASAR